MRLAMVAACLLLAACSSGPTTHAALPANPHVVHGRCPDLIVHGLRGQTQSATKNQGVGHEVLVTFDSLVAHLPRHSGTTLRLEPISYPALAEGTEAGYDRDVAAGKRLLTASLAKAAKSCPKSRSIVMGYSEGAQVVHVTMAGLPAAAAKSVAAVALLADPLRNPKDPIVTESYDSGSLTGRGNAGYGKHFDSDLRVRVITFCAKSDNVCNAPLGGRVGPISETHRSYYEKSTTAQVSGMRIAGLVASHP